LLKHHIQIRAIIRGIHCWFQLKAF